MNVHILGELHMRPHGPRITATERRVMRAEVWQNVIKACSELGYEIPKEPINFNSYEGLTRLHRLHCAGYSHSVMAILLGSRRKAVQGYLAKLRKKAAENGDGISE